MIHSGLLAQGLHQNQTKKPPCRSSYHGAAEPEEKYDQNPLFLQNLEDRRLQMKPKVLLVSSFEKSDRILENVLHLKQLFLSVLYVKKEGNVTHIWETNIPNNGNCLGESSDGI